MRAMTVIPGQEGTAGVDDVPGPDPWDGQVLVRGLAVGVCGTDREIAEGSYGTPPPGDGKLIVGHESLGEVLEAPTGSGFARGDLVVGIVRRPCPAQRTRGARSGPPDPTLWDMCRNDSFGERGIVPIGLMACLLGVQRGYEVHVADLAVAGAKRDLVEALGARYHAGDAAEIGVEVDVVIECTGLGAVGRSAATSLVSGGIMCLTGLMSRDPTLDVDATALNRAMVLRNVVMFGTVNAGKRHWEQAAVALAAADASWLSALITRRVPLGRWTEALERQPEDIKVVVDLTA